MVSVLDAVVAVGAISAAAGAVARIVTGRGKKPMSRVFASGTLLVTGDGDVLIDEVLPKDKALLLDPDKYITVEFDPTEPPPPPCAGGLSDEVDWELVFKHEHDTHLEHGDKAEDLKLKVSWRVSTARTIVWKILSSL